MSWPNDQEKIILAIREWHNTAFCERCGSKTIIDHWPTKKHHTATGDVLHAVVIRCSKSKKFWGPFTGHQWEEMWPLTLEQLKQVSSRL